MKIAVIGSRNIVEVDLSKYVADGDEIVSGGAVGVDRCATEYARERGLRITEFLPEYKLYGRAAPIKRNKTIVDYSDLVVAFWDGSSKGTKWVIEYARKTGKPCEVVMCLCGDKT